MRGSRTKDEHKANVIAAKLNNPDIKLREIQESTGVNRETARKIIEEELPEVVQGSANVKELFERNSVLQSAADALIAEMVANKDKSITVAQLTSLRDSTFKQNQLIEMAKAGKDESKTIVIQI